ncbi:MAG: hypothetical protein JWO76_282 [Nocardioides sp.]|nr:hypothetical protein [Nocardioides sp.]
MLAVANGHFFTRAEARDLGYDDRDVARLVRHRVWVRFRRGFYCFADVWDPLDDVGRHQVRSRAVLRSLGSAVALSHVSGAIAHGVSVWGVDLRRVHVTRLDGGPGRIEGDVVHHEGFCLDEDVIEIAGCRALQPERCALEAASRTSSESALVILDSLLCGGKADVDTLMRRFELMWCWPFMRSLHIVVRMADGRAQSVGESRGRHLCWVGRLPAPELQFEVYDASGTLIGVTDWAWPAHGLLGEFDGRVKYGRLLKPGMDAGAVVFAEKEREDLLRDVTGMRMVRVIWSDYDRPQVTAARIRRRLDKAC